MLAYIILFWAGRAFYRLAEQYGKSPWGYAILSILVFFGIQLVFIFASAVVWAISDPEGFDTWLETDDDSSTLVGDLVASLLGYLGMWGFYQLLQRRWANASPKQVYDPELLDQPEQ